MYRIIAYHGKGNNKELEKDLRLLWGGFREFLRHRLINHVYCFQSVSEKKGAELIFILQYGDNVATKLALHGKPKLASQLRNHVDYWFYVRDGHEIKNNSFDRFRGQ